jgi:predicted nucleic acid-binding protein
MSDFVLDASTALALFLPNTPAQEEYSDYVFTLIKNGAVPAVPNIWVVEISAVLARSKKAGRISKATLDKACGYYDQLSVDVHYIEYTTKKLVQLSAIYNLAGYDAVYFDLAKFLNIPIASVDKGHFSACKAHGVELL